MTYHMYDPNTTSRYSCAETKTTNVNMRGGGTLRARGLVSQARFLICSTYIIHGQKVWSNSHDSLVLPCQQFCIIMMKLVVSYCVHCKYTPILNNYYGRQRQGMFDQTLLCMQMMCTEYQKPGQQDYQMPMWCLY